MYIKYFLYSIRQLFCMALCYLTNPLSKHWKWCIYLGWKFDFYDPGRAMIATRLTIHRR